MDGEEDVGAGDLTKMKNAKEEIRNLVHSCKPVMTEVLKELDSTAILPTMDPEAMRMAWMNMISTEMIILKSEEISVKKDTSNF